MNSENLHSWKPSGKKKRQIRDPQTRGRQNSRLRDSKIPRKRDFETHQKHFWFRDRTKIFRDPRFRLFFGLHTCRDLYCDLHNTIDRVLTVLPSLTIKRKIYVDFKQNWLVTSTNWKLGECVRQWFHWTIHVIFLQTRLNLKTKVKHRYQFLGWPRKSPWKICGEQWERRGTHPSDAIRDFKIQRRGRQRAWAWIWSLEIQLQEGSPTFDKVKREESSLLRLKERKFTF